MSEKRLTIGLFICHLDNDYAYDICKGVDYATKELDINLVIFPGMYINAAYNDPANAKYDYQYNSVFYYAKPESIDALIISIGTISTFLDDAETIDFLNRFKDIPILTLESEYPGFPSLIIDSTQGLKDIILHLINDHSKKHIGYVSGRPGDAAAEERLAIYKSTIVEAGLPLDESLIVHGNFSEYCEELVEDLLDTHPEIDALCFANDQMALGGYNVLKRRGIQIGKDIAVTGFDDVPLALALEPELTTVRASACELGYRSVYEVLSLIKTGKTNISRLNSAMIVRKSCGCAGAAKSSNETNTLDLNSQNKQELVDSIIEQVFASDKDTFIYSRISAIMSEYVSVVLDTVMDTTKTDFPVDEFQDIIRKYHNSDIPLYYSIVQLNFCLRAIENLVLNLISDPAKRIAFCQATNTISAQLLTAESSNRYNDKHEYKLNTWTSSYIVRDTMSNSNNLELAYTQIADKLQKLDLISSYIFSLRENVYLSPDGIWHIPDSIQLQVYNKDQISTPLCNSEKYVSIKDLFNNPYIPQKRRYTMILTPIFTSEDHHGVFLCEADIAYFHHIYSINFELGTTLKFLKMYEEEQQTNQQLEYTLSLLHEKNRQLSKISTIDELTGLKNRRGFLTETQAVISSEINKGQRAILLFADMDNLKKVNDQFGHADGDFALRTIASALKTSLRNDDIIGRIGGDEFVGFALLGNQQSAETISNRIHKKLEDFNTNSEKPYYVEASVGIFDFVCDPGLDIQDLIKNADSALYENKSHKRTSVLKEEQ